MKKKIIAILIISILIIVVIAYGMNSNDKKQDDGKTKILTSFYPIYIMTLNMQMIMT